MATAVYLEVGAKRVFACARDWPGWCRSGKDEDLALEALAAYAPRYSPVVALAGGAFPARATAFDVVERVAGSSGTEFGVPTTVLASDGARLPTKEAARLAALVEASWTTLDRVVAGAPAELRKGPRGGGRDRDAVFAHVLDGETAYARKLGLKLRRPANDDEAAIAANRRQIADTLRAAAPPAERGWPIRYAARRIAWHLLDHAWEIEDRSES